jgi:hypothetical protein
VRLDVDAARFEAHQREGDRAPEHVLTLRSRT